MSNPVDVQKDIATDFVHGRTIVGQSALQLTTFNRGTYKGVQLRASTSNTGLVYIGSIPGVTAETNVNTDGYPLEAGDQLFVPIDNPSKIYIIGSAADQGIFWLMI